MKNLPQRKSIRLKNYDYSWSGFYFITICSQNRKCLFGKITDGKMVFNNAGKIIQWFKTMTTNYYIRGVKTNKWKPFAKRLWQRNYYERIIRNENDLNKIREYIINNPKIWDNDRENPKNWRKIL